MKHLKVVGLAATATMAMAAFGASNAAATTLCATAPESHICPSPLSAGTVIEFSLKSNVKSVLTANNGLKINCTASSGKGKTTSAGGKGANVAATLESLTMTGCSNSLGQNCTMTVDTLDYNASVEWWPATHTGVMTVWSGGKGAPQTTAVCGEAMKTTCVYGATSIVVDLMGGSFAEIWATAEPLSKIEGPVACGDTATWGAEYSIKKPEALYVENE